MAKPTGAREDTDFGYTITATGSPLVADFLYAILPAPWMPMRYQGQPPMLEQKRCPAFALRQKIDAPTSCSVFYQFAAFNAPLQICLCEGTFTGDIDAWQTEVECQKSPLTTHGGSQGEVGQPAPQYLVGELRFQITDEGASAPDFDGGFVRLLHDTAQQASERAVEIIDRGKTTAANRSYIAGEPADAWVMRWAVASTLNQLTHRSRWAQSSPAWGGTKA